MEKISAVLIIKNEENKIRECLENLNSFVDEIIIVDDESTDNTINICKEFTDKIYVNKLKTFGGQRNFGIKKTKNDWVLNFDADEKLTPELKEEIKKELSIKSDITGFSLRRINVFMDRKIKYSGWQNDRFIRLFNKNFITYDENRPSHEKLIFNNAKIKLLKNVFIHNTYINFENTMSKMYYMSTDKAIDRLKRTKKIGIYYLLFKPCYRFIYHFVFRFGFLDGRQGLVIAFCSSFELFMTYVKIWRMQNNESFSGVIDQKYFK